MLWLPIVLCLVEKLSHLARNDKPIGKARRHQELARVVSVYHLPKLGDERRRSTATSNTAPLGHPNQFALWLLDLVM
jgi:hypothetical protein